MPRSGVHIVRDIKKRQKEDCGVKNKRISFRATSGASSLGEQRIIAQQAKASGSHFLNVSVLLLNTLLCGN